MASQAKYAGKDGDDSQEKGKMFIGGLSWETTHDSLMRHFSQYGQVVDCVVMKNPETGRSRGFGFITFADPANVDLVLQNTPHILDNRTIDPKPCNPRAGMARPARKTSQNGYKVFLGGLPANLTETDLRNFFLQYGKVSEVVIMYDQEKKKSRGFGFLTFESEEAVDRCCSEHYVTIQGKQVEIKKAEPRDSSRPSGGMGRGGRGGGGGGGWDGSGMGMHGGMGGPMGYQGGWGGPGPGGPNQYGYGPQGGYQGWGPQGGQWGGYGGGYGGPGGNYGYGGPPQGAGPQGGYNWNWGPGPQGPNGAGGPAPAPAGPGVPGVQPKPDASYNTGYGSGNGYGNGGGYSADASQGYPGGYRAENGAQGYGNGQGYGTADGVVPASGGAVPGNGMGGGPPAGQGAGMPTAGPGPQRGGNYNQPSQSQYHPYRRGV